VLLSKTMGETDMTSTFGTTNEPVHPAAPNPGDGLPPVALAPTDAPPPTVLLGAQMKQRNPFLVWLVFPVITLGIYSLVWYFKIHNEMLRFDPRQPIKPAGSLLTVMFGGIIIVPPFVSYFNTGKRIATAQRAAGLPATSNPWIGFVLIFVFGLSSLYYQMELNKIVKHYRVPERTPVALAA
jgi:Domain of unknown function (DUF4234)